MAFPDFIWLLLWSVAGISLAAITAPPILGLLGLSRYRSTHDDDPCGVRPEGRVNSHDKWMVQQLADLGLRPMGRVWEKAYFFTIHWCKAFCLDTYASSDQSYFACVYRLVPRERVRIAMVTCFENGGMVWTGNHMPEEKRVEENHHYVRWGVATSDLSELEAAHRQVVDRFSASGLRLCRHDCLAGLATNLENHGRRLLYSPGVHASLLVASLTCPAIGLILVWTTFGDVPWAPPVGLTAGCLAWIVAVQCVLRSVARERQVETGRESRPIESGRVG